ncbi:hypothetical protein JCM11641_006456 [Rhodosporidiobolus odoratus]
MTSTLTVVFKVMRRVAEDRRVRQHPHALELQHCRYLESLSCASNHAALAYAANQARIQPYLVAVPAHAAEAFPAWLKIANRLYGHWRKVKSADSETLYDSIQYIQHQQNVLVQKRLSSPYTRCLGQLSNTLGAELESRPEWSAGYSVNREIDTWVDALLRWYSPEPFLVATVGRTPPHYVPFLRPRPSWAFWGVLDYEVTGDRYR